MIRKLRAWRWRRWYRRTYGDTTLSYVYGVIRFSGPGDLPEEAA